MKREFLVSCSMLGKVLDHMSSVAILVIAGVLVWKYFSPYENAQDNSAIEEMSGKHLEMAQHMANVG